MKLVAFLLSCAIAFGQNAFYLRPGDTVVFFGDSITDQRLYTTFVETYTVTRFPKMNVTFIHSGWGGDKVTGGGGGPIDIRLNRDVFAYKPTVVTVMLGMNDGRVRAFDQSIFDEYAKGYRFIVKSVKTAFPEARLTLIQPSPYDDVTRPPTFEGGYNSVLARYGQFLKELAAKEHVDVADMNTPVVAELKRAYEIDAAGAQKLIPDRVHPGAAGHLLMAKALLKAWNAPALVSAVEIDGETGKVTRSENTAVTGLNGLTWTQLDNALPMPLNLSDAGIELALKASDVVESLDQQTLKIRGLKAPRYKLSIDDELVGSFSREQLTEGINLAILPTPMGKQAADVHAMTVKHTNIHNARWRMVQTPLATDVFAATQPAMDALDKLDAEMIARQRSLAQPKPRRFHLTPE
jgi:lysophospholipase L1-like esterase